MAGWRQKHHVWSLCLLAYFFFPLLWISQYNYPSGDDYVQFTQAHELGTLAAVRWWYFNWTGRYTSFFIQSLFPDYDTWLTAYRIVPAVLFLVSFACLFYFVRAFFGTRFSRSEVFTFASVSFILLVSLTPEIATGFYWLPTNVQNLGAVFFSLLLLGLCIDLHGATESGTRVALWVAVVVLIAVLAGLNEISLLFSIGSIALATYVQFVDSRRLPTLSLAVLALAVVFACVGLLAPGNALRVNHVSPQSHPIGALVSAAGLTVYLFLRLLSLPTLFVTSALYLVFLQVNRDRLDHLRSLLSRLRWYWIPPFLFALTLITLVPVTAAAIHSVPDRIANVYIYNLALGWFFSLTVLFINQMSAGSRFALPRWAIGLLSASILAFLLTGFDVHFTSSDIPPSSNRIQRDLSALRTKSVYTNAYLDILSGRAALYATQNEDTTNRFRAANGGCVEFRVLSHVPETIFVPFVKYPWTWCPDYVRLHWPSRP